MILNLGSHLKSSLLQLTEPALCVIPSRRRLEVYIVQESSHAGVLQTLEHVLERSDLRLEELHKVALAELLSVVQLPAELEVAN